MVSNQPTNIVSYGSSIVACNSTFNGSVLNLTSCTSNARKVCVLPATSLILMAMVLLSKFLVVWISFLFPLSAVPACHNIVFFFFHSVTVAPERWEFWRIPPYSRIVLTHQEYQKIKTLHKVISNPNIFCIKMSIKMHNSYDTKISDGFCKIQCYKWLLIEGGKKKKKRNYFFPFIGWKHRGGQPMGWLWGRVLIRSFLFDAG